MPVRSIPTEMNVAQPLPPIKSKQPGVTSSLLYSGSRFVGHQKSKGNQYDVEVILQVRSLVPCLTYFWIVMYMISNFLLVCQYWRMLFMWIPQNKGTNGRLSDSNNIFRWWNNFQETSISHQKVGSWWRCRQKTLGNTFFCSLRVWVKKNRTRPKVGRF